VIKDSKDCVFGNADAPTVQGRIDLCSLTGISDDGYLQQDGNRKIGNG